MNIKNICMIISLLFLICGITYNYKKNKKAYNLCFLVPLLDAIFILSPLSKHISTKLDTIIGVLVGLFFIVGLLLYNIDLHRTIRK